MASICICTRLRGAARTTSAIYDSALAPVGISVSQYALLRAVERLGCTSLTALAAETGHDRTTLSRTLRPLAASALIAMDTGADKRKRRVRLTVKGQAILEQGLPHWRRAQQEVADMIGGDGAALFALLDRIERAAA